ncbi:MAG: nucleotidyltransferase domain-containing protein [Candidatus Tectomicrobia bacterium]|uniref:Nucleotidyltransferase domain-containing protein n=1 Tax=Tectimicrobiota bacterium TaxID=2528274 RepID=A0A932GP91_UNCTE|nr:nucleotidyltransferase domain-containing protein [Candidatus Tectomicrobia bacterium]
MNGKVQIEIPTEKIAEFCRRNHIRKLSFFGSVLRDDFRPDSDVDVLVEFESEHVPGLIRLAGMEIELSGLLGGRNVDINTPKCLGRYFRDDVLSQAQVQYVES